ncbi:hypothetical protein Q0M94_22845 (plasmid) [Deinococcus radiomollis]|uniref:hypothetical protein n=1 Tax=Deinococcus radiomollis TaxID=468916 RepID=UPI003892550E
MRDLGCEPQQLGDPRQVCLERPTVQQRLACWADIRGCDVDDACDGVTRRSLLEGEGPLHSAASGRLRVGLGRLAAVRHDVPFDQSFQLLDALPKAGILFGQFLVLGD